MAHELGISRRTVYHYLRATSWTMLLFRPGWQKFSIPEILS
ncbi:MAG: hypothetical protein ACRDRS_04345 [Pseudonocardiaceae bacterium]